MRKIQFLISLAIYIFSISYPLIFIEQMEANALKKYSKSSRDILYRLKKILITKKSNFNKLSCEVFGHLRTKFSVKQFHLLIKKYDANVNTNELDKLFQTLDQNKNDVVFLQDIKFVIKCLPEQESSKQQKNTQNQLKEEEQGYLDTKQTTNLKLKEEQLNQIAEFKTKFISSEYYIKIARQYVTKEAKYVYKENFGQILSNLSIKSEEQRNTLTSLIFGTQNRIRIRLFLQKIGLVDSDEQKNEIEDDQIDEFQQKQSIMTIPMKKQTNFKKLYNINDVPKSLRRYFNQETEINEDFANLAIEYLSSNRIFVDDENPQSKSATKQMHIFDWMPDYQIFQIAQQNPIETKQIKNINRKIVVPQHINQKKFGDCYFLSSIAAFAQDYPELIIRLFVLQKNPSHLFGVKLFIYGQWQTFALDGYFPLHWDGDFQVAQSYDKQIWTMLLEKALAKAFKSYKAIQGGLLQEGLVAISGAPTFTIFTLQQDFIRRAIIEFQKGAVISCATGAQIAKLKFSEQENLGIYGLHAYTLLNIYENLPYKDSLITLLKIRNPHGKRQWNGNWSYNSLAWTNQLRQIVKYVTNPCDGTFFMSVEDFQLYFSLLNISKINLSYKNSFVLNKSNKNNFYQNKFSIQKKGDYFFTLYQESPKKYADWPKGYRRSRAWLFLAKIKKETQTGQIDQLTSIACKTSSDLDLTIQATLEPGQYVLISKVSWRYWNDHHYKISSYGPTDLKIQECKISSNELLNNFFSSRADIVASFCNEKRFLYQKYQIQRRYDFSLDGIGYIRIINLDNVTLETEITFIDDKGYPCLKGLQAIPPFKIPLRMRVKPYEIKTAGFIVDQNISNSRRIILQQKFNIIIDNQNGLF